MVNLKFKSKAPDTINFRTQVLLEHSHYLDNITMDIKIRQTFLYCHPLPLPPNLQSPRNYFFIFYRYMGIAILSKMQKRHKKNPKGVGTEG